MTDPASLYRAEAAEAAEAQNPTPTKPARRLHEPFVSPEFGASAALKRRSSRLNGVVDGNDGGERPAATFHGTGNTNPQAAPLYTVSAAGAADSGGMLVAPPSALSDSLLLGKRLDVADAACLSVVGSAAATPLNPIAGLNGSQYQPKTDKVPPPQVSRNQVEAKGTLKSPLTSPQDISPLVTEAACTWGQELGTILGQEVLHPATTKPRMEIMSLAGRPALTTTGLFPQMMTLRFSSSVRVSSVHLRASSVLRLIVQPGEGLLGDGRADGKTVTVPAVSRHWGSRDEGSGQDIDVDVRDIPSFEDTRSLTVIITAGSKAFCSIHRIYALGVREDFEQA